MAAKKPSKGKTSSSSQIRAKNRQIWAAANADQWLSFLKTNDSENKPWKLKGASVVGHCRADSHPGEDSNPSMMVTPERGMVKCFSCGYFESDPLRFVQLISKKTTAETAKDLHASFGVKVLSVPEMRQAEEEFKHQQMKAALSLVLRTELHEAHQAFILHNHAGPEPFSATAMGYSEELLLYLKKRGILENSMHFPIGLLPNEYALKKRAEALGISGHDIAGMTKYMKDVLTPFYQGSLIFINRSSPRDITRFRLRRPGPGESKNIIMIDDPREDFMGWFGLCMYGELVDKKDGMGAGKKFLGFEGEFDFLQYANGQIENGNFDLPAIAHGGAANHQLSGLKDFGLEECYYVPDLDAGGDQNAKDILEENPDLTVRLFNWPDGLLVAGSKTDIDEAIKHFGWETVNNELCDFEKNWSKPELWCKEQVKKIVRDKKLEDDVTAVSKVVFSFAPCIGDASIDGHATKIRAWTQSILSELGFSTGEAQKVTDDFLAKDSDDALFQQTVTEALWREYEFICVDLNKTHVPFMVLNRKKKNLFELRLSSEAHIRAIIGASSGSLASWAKANMTLPDFIRYTTTKSGELMEKPLPAQDDELYNYVILALRDISSKVPPAGSLHRFGDGCHWLPTGTGNSMFVVNGNLVFRGWFDKDGGLQWEDLEIPVYDKYLFNTTREPWSKFLTSIEALRDAPAITLRALLYKVADILNIGWSFRGQETETLAHAAFIVASCVLKIFPQNLQFLAANERGCGKSTLYAELIGGGKNTDINLVEHSYFADMVTSAGIRQAMDGSSRILVLDEIDNTSGSRLKAEKLEEIFSILRCCSAGDGIMLQGSQSGEAKTYRMSFSTMIAGIDPNVTNANMTRFYTTDLQSGLDTRETPRASILTKYTVEDIAKIRQEISLCVFPHIPKILQGLNLAKAYLAEKTETNDGVLQRFKDSMSLIMAVLYAADYDWKDWGRKTVISKQDSLKSMKNMTMNDNLVNSVLYTSCITTGEIDKKHMMVSDFFSTEYAYSRRGELNSSGCGCYLYHDEPNAKWYLLICWMQAVRVAAKAALAVKSNSSIYALKTIADRHESAIPDDEARVILDRLPEVQSYLKGIPTTLLDVTSYVFAEDARSARIVERARSKPATNNVTSIRSPH